MTPVPTDVAKKKAKLTVHVMTSAGGPNNTMDDFYAVGDRMPGLDEHHNEPGIGSYYVVLSNHNVTQT